jgi:hypothetical protein
VTTIQGEAAWIVLDAPGSVDNRLAELGGVGHCCGCSSLRSSLM